MKSWCSKFAVCLCRVYMWYIYKEWVLKVCGECACHVYVQYICEERACTQCIYEKCVCAHMAYLLGVHVVCTCGIPVRTMRVVYT